MPIIKILKKFHLNKALKYRLEYNKKKEIIYLQRFFKDGKLERFRNCDPQIKRCVEISYYPNGEKRMAGSYMNGKKHGMWKYWDKDGECFLMQEYSRGKLQRELSQYIDLKHFNLK